MGEWRTFQGTWTAEGDRHALELGPARRASVMCLSGSMLLTGERGIGAGFRARAIAFTDDQSGLVGRAVWTDEHGDEIFSELRGDPVGSGRTVTGRIVGGTGRWEGISGEYRFDWRYVVETAEGEVQGRAEHLAGRARIDRPAPAGKGSP